MRFMRHILAMSWCILGFLSAKSSHGGKSRDQTAKTAALDRIKNTSVSDLRTLTAGAALDGGDTAIHFNQ